MNLNAFINIYDCKINKIYVDKFWNNINNKKWLYIDDTVIDWIGYMKTNGKFKYVNLIKENFIENIDYKTYTYDQINAIFHSPLRENENNKEILEYKDQITNIHNRTIHLILSPRCFKKSLMMIRTDKANQIRDYYVDIEELCLEYNKFLLDLKDNELKENLINDNYKINALIQSLAIKPVVYFGFINKYTIKFGHSNDIKQRIKDHIKTYDSFKIIYIKECHNNKLIENKIRQYAKENNTLTSMIINGNNYTELITISNNFTINMLINKIDIECANISTNINEQFITLQNENTSLYNRIDQLNIKIKDLLKDNEILNITNKILGNELYNCKHDKNIKVESIKQYNTETKYEIEYGDKVESKSHIKKEFNLEPEINIEEEIKPDFKPDITKEDKSEYIEEETKPKEKKKFTCARCNESFRTNINLTKHINRINKCKDINEILEFKCTKCNHEFTCQKSLDRHLSDKRKYPCDQPKQKKTYNCEKCGKFFEKKGRYNEHLRKQTKCDMNLTCKDCGHKFTILSNYNSHINSKFSCV